MGLSIPSQACGLTARVPPAAAGAGRGDPQGAKAPRGRRDRGALGALASGRCGGGRSRLLPGGRAPAGGAGRGRGAVGGAGGSAAGRGLGGGGAGGAVRC